MQFLKLAFAAVALMGSAPLVQAADAPKADPQAVEDAGTSKAQGKAAEAKKLDEKPLQVVKAAFGTAIQDRQLVGESNDFDASAGRVYCWTEIQAKDAPAAIRHIWYMDGQKVAEVPLKVAASHFRTWSSKAVGPGKWKVEVVDDNGGEILATAEFSVKG